jgi:predicted signal transduction protein with EAL and GGDEF domain
LGITRRFAGQLRSLTLIDKHSTSLSDRPAPARSDVIVVVRRDGVLLEYVAGHGVFDIDPAADPAGQSLERLWPSPIAQAVKHLVRRAIADRGTAQGRLHHDQDFHARAVPQGPDRAVCVIQAVAAAPPGEAEEPGENSADRPFDRRGFMRRFKHSMSSAALRESPTAIVYVQVDGIADIARSIGSLVAGQVSEIAIQRLMQVPGHAASGGDPPWYMGQLGEGALALVLQTADRVAIEACVGRACESLSEPVVVGDAAFHLTPHAGVAILGRDASSPKMLLDHARAAASEARRCGPQAVCFFSDTLKLRSLARLDVARELADAIEQRAIHLEYLGRHDLATGRLTARVAYLRWRHPLRGDVRPAEFVSVAEATGFGHALSCCALERLREDYELMAQHEDPEVRISFGALRHHLLRDDFVEEMSRFIAGGAIPPERFELRIAERAFLVIEPATLLPLQEMGVRLIVDEVGRGMTSLDRLARAPLWGLQLDRSWVTALHRDPIALKVCRAGIGMAAALGLVPIATGVDTPAQRRVLFDLGCRHGMGDMYLPGAQAPSSAAI